jgi:serine/threonine protein kinase
MDLIEGEDLAIKTDRGISPFEAALFAAQTAEAVAFCHQAGVIHGDLKPSNVIADSRGAVHLTDFGLARLIDGDPDESSSVIAGTAAFMAPEQVDSRWGKITSSIDIYALGALLYTLLCGRPPYFGNCREEVLAHVAAGEVHPAPIRDADAAVTRLAHIAMQCLCKHSAQRFASAREVADALRQAASPVQ